MTHTYLLEVELAEPTALTDGSSDAGGGHTTLDHLSGTTLLGAFAASLGISPGDDLFRRTFLSPATRFLNAYPSAGALGRTLPRPLTFRVGKLNRGLVHDSIRHTGESISHETLAEHFTNQGAGDTMKSSRGAFVTETAPAADHAPKRVEQVHVGIDRTTRAAADGVLFTYEAIRAGARFHGAIETDDDAVAEILAKHPQIPLRLGRSRGAGYGHATARLTKAPSSWKEHSTTPTPPTRATVLTLLSDYLPHLETAPAENLRAELAALAGVTIEQIRIRSASTRQVRGFRGVWGLPRPPRTALAKGSVLVIEGSVDAAKLTKALAAGIGARTNEGFGRIAVNWSIHGESTDGKATDREQPASASATRQARPKAAFHAATVHAATRAVSTRRTERKVREFVEAALRLDRVAKAAAALGRLQPAQLGNLRAAVSGTMSPAEIGAWFKALSDKTAGERWRKLTVPAIAVGKPHRAGHAFAWESLFGGICSNQDALEGDISLENWKSVIAALAEQVKRADLSDAAKKDPEMALRYFIAGFVSDVSRLKNMQPTQEAAGGARS